jgi:peroxiredoxin
VVAPEQGRERDAPVHHQPREVGRLGRRLDALRRDPEAEQGRHRPDVSNGIRLGRGMHLRVLGHLRDCGHDVCGEFGAEIGELGRDARRPLGDLSRRIHARNLLAGAPMNQTTAMAPTMAPAWTTTTWLNSDPLTLEDLRGRVVVLEAFQMLCPGCVSAALPQASRLTKVFGDEIAVVGLHSVFEHHEAMTETALRAFVHEYGLQFPIGIDAHNAFNEPVTFVEYEMRGTPTTVLIDPSGRLRAHHLGAVDDMALARAITQLAMEPLN